MVYTRLGWKDFPGTNTLTLLQTFVKSLVKMGPGRGLPEPEHPDSPDPKQSKYSDCQRPVIRSPRWAVLDRDGGRHPGPKQRSGLSKRPGNPSVEGSVRLTSALGKFVLLKSKIYFEWRQFELEQGDQLYWSFAFSKNSLAKTRNSVRCISHHRTLTDG